MSGACTLHLEAPPKRVSANANIGHSLGIELLYRVAWWHIPSLSKAATPSLFSHLPSSLLCYAVHLLLHFPTRSFFLFLLAELRPQACKTPRTAHHHAGRVAATTPEVTLLLFQASGSAALRVFRPLGLGMASLLC